MSQKTLKATLPLRLRIQRLFKAVCRCAKATANATFAQRKATLICRLLLGLCLFAPLTGCKSIGFDKPSLPSLAFWKKDSELPPPPARHFDPSRFDSNTDAQLADAEDSFDEYGQKRQGQDRDYSNDSLAKDLSTGNTSSARKSPRKPYGMEDFASDAQDTLKSAENSFDLNTNKLKNKFDSSLLGSKNEIESGLSDAQQKFRDAMNATTQSNSFSGDNNSFASKPISNSQNRFEGFDPAPQANDFAAKNDSFDLQPTSPTFNSAASLNDKLRSAANNLNSEFKSKLQAPASSQLKSEFEKRLAAAQAAAQKTTDQANRQLDKIADASAQTRNAIAKPFDGLSNGGFSAKTPLNPESKSAGTFDSFQLAKPNQLASTKNLADDTVSAMRSEVEQARRQIELLKQQVAAAKLAASEKATRAATQTQGAFDAVRDQAAQGLAAAENTIQGIVLPLNANNDASQFDDSPRVANQNNQFAPGSSNSFSPSKSASPPVNNRALQPQNSGSASGGSFYPSTPYGKFGSNQKSLVPAPNQTSIGQASFDSPESNSFGTRQARAEMPADSGFGFHRADHIESHVPDVQIPASILTGKGSFAPGSTTPLKR